ncbi:MAG: hypothetical protein JW846_01525 [Dehalococcoidia bacterium]|nr:hypothetical protein [Dehalococcoidia bacterium]
MSPFGLFHNVDQDLVDVNVHAYFDARAHGASHCEALEIMVKTRYVAAWDRKKKDFILEELEHVPPSPEYRALRLIIFDMYGVESRTQSTPLKMFGQFDAALKKYQGVYPRVVLAD